MPKLRSRRYVTAACLCILSFLVPFVVTRPVDWIVTGELPSGL
ncbi:MAG: hypothetical protein Q7W51_07850 [Coriobacteriia bacterium]|nr:hypothetical protein [Coriobacteriia bacterium]